MSFGAETLAGAPSAYQMQQPGFSMSQEYVDAEFRRMTGQIPASESTILDEPESPDNWAAMEPQPDDHVELSHLQIENLLRHAQAVGPIVASWREQEVVDRNRGR